MKVQTCRETGSTLSSRGSSVPLCGGGRDAGDNCEGN